MSGGVAWLLGVAAALLFNLLLGLVVIARGRARTERLLAAQLCGTTATAVLLLLAQYLAIPALRDVALVFALLGAVVSVAFVRLNPQPMP